MTQFSGKFYLTSEKISRQRCLLSPSLFNTTLEVLARAIRLEKDMKGIQIGKKETISICRDSRTICILYIKKSQSISKKATRPSKQILQKLQVASSVHKKVSCISISISQQSKKEIKKATSFIIASKTIPRNQCNYGGERPVY